MEQCLNQTHTGGLVIILRQTGSHSYMIVIGISCERRGLKDHLRPLQQGRRSWTGTNLHLMNVPGADFVAFLPGRALHGRVPGASDVHDMHSA